MPNTATGDVAKILVTIIILPPPTTAVPTTAVPTTAVPTTAVPPTPTPTPTLTPTPTPTLTPTPPANDNFDTATKVISLPYAITEDVNYATTAADDPIFTCSNGQKFKTVWFAYNPTKNGLLTVDTLGSGFDTVLAVWTGTRGNLALAACNDDALGFTQSQVQLSVASGQSYYIEAASYDSSISDPSLKLNASFTVLPTPIPTLTRTPTASPSTITFQSIGSQDGQILESAETSNIGGAMNSTATTINLGDDATKKQYRDILSFSTGAILPDNAVITGVTLKVRQQAIIGGGNPVSIFGGFMFDVKNGFFGTALTLQIGDFQAAGSASYGPSAPAPVGGWYSFNLTGAKAYINKLATNSGLTQIRLRFKLDDNNNAIANYLSLYSGNAPAANQPQLVITYVMP
ncbi:MAG: DNRLRE domain-containing protein [Anaerolineales bacterium]